MAETGRPPLYTDPEKLSDKIDEYFIAAKADNDPYRVTALALHLGMHSKSTLYEYAKLPEFSHSIKMALLRIEDGHVGRALTNDKVTGDLFVLKCSYGYRETAEIDINHGGQKDNKLDIQVSYIDSDQSATSK